MPLPPCSTGISMPMNCRAWARAVGPAKRRAACVLCEPHCCGVARAHAASPALHTHSVRKEPVDDLAVHLRRVVHAPHARGDDVFREPRGCEGRKKAATVRGLTGSAGRRMYITRRNRDARSEDAPASRIATSSSVSDVSGRCAGAELIHLALQRAGNGDLRALLRSDRTRSAIGSGSCVRVRLRSVAGQSGGGGGCADASLC